MSAPENINILTIIIVVVLVTLTVAVIRLFFMSKKVLGSFAKLGFLMREDAKKYFDDAAVKIVDTNEEFQEMYQKIVENGTKEALKDASTIMRTVISNAHEESAKTVLKAQTDAANIISSAEKEASEKKRQIIEQAVETIRWTLNEYVAETFTVEQHEELINKLLQGYIDEQR